MSYVSLNQLTSDAHSDFEKLFKKTQNKAMEYNKKYQRNDARREFFMTFYELNAWLLIQLDDFLITLDRSSQKIQRYMQLTEQDRSTFLSQFDTVNRSSYLTKLIFDTENYVKSVMKQLGQPFDDGYFELSKNFLKTLNLLTDQKHKIMILPARIRNSLHNNGYTKFDINVVLRGRPYKAQKGDKVKFSGWDNLYIMLDELTDLLIDVTDNSKINTKKQIQMLYPN